jgi:hypothetical protein
MKAIKPYIGTIVVFLVMTFVLFKVVPMNVRKVFTGS